MEKGKSRRRERVEEGEKLEKGMGWRRERVG